MTSTPNQEQGLGKLAARKINMSVFSVDSRGTPFPHGERSARNGEVPSTLSLLYLGSIFILLLCALSCMFAFHRTTRIMRESLDLLEKQVEIQSTMSKAYRYNPTSTSRDVELLKFGRMVRLDDCPPCPTEPPTNPVEPHRNPVSVLNQEVGNRAKYTIQYVCESPHIHTATLTIDDPAFQGKTWTGKGPKQQQAKQAAAWKAIQEDLTHLVDLVADEYKPPLYGPTCNATPKPSITNKNETNNPEQLNKN